MKYIKKISVICLCICFLVNIHFVIGDTISPTKTMVFDDIGTYQGLCYEGKVLKIPFAVCWLDDGGNIPIYSLTQEKKYTTGYNTKVNQIVHNSKIKEILKQGYPNNMPKELEGCDEKEAYLVTQIAILDLKYQYNLEKFSVASNNTYPNIIEHIKQFVTKMRSLNPQEVMPELKIEKLQEQQTQDKITKTYCLLSNVNIQNYTVEISQVDNLQLTNEQDEPKQVFMQGEKFKIIYLGKENKEEEDDQDKKMQNLEIEISIKANANTSPVRKGTTPSDNWEEYVFLDKMQLLEVKQKEIWKIEEETPPSDNKEEIQTPSEKEEPSQKPTTPPSQEEKTNKPKPEENVQKSNQIKRLPRTGL